MTIKAEENGSMTVYNDRMRVTFRADGTLVVASKDAVQLAGDSLVRVKDCVDEGTAFHVLRTLGSSSK